MGNQESARRVSFENDEPENVVKVSEKVVVELLKQSGEGESAQRQKQSTNESQHKSGTQSKVSDEPFIRFSSGDPKIHPGKYVHSQKKLPEKLSGDSEPSTTEESTTESEVQKHNEYWESKIKALEETHERINNIVETEKQKAIDEVNELFGKLPSKDWKELCSAEKSAVLDCYKQNPDKPLMCSDVVQAFSDCINGARNSS